MKTTLTTLAILFAAGTAHATTIQGCDVVDMGGYLNKADPTCVFSEVLPGSVIVREGDRSASGILAPDDGNPATNGDITVRDN